MPFNIAARSLLEQAEVKQELKVPPEYIPVMPIIVGYPRRPTAPTPRKEPEILCWK
ncbi:MAG: hypothetical protein ACM3U2_05800 [Deltaproteobacteria bacterium]